VGAGLAILDPQAKGDDRVEPSSYLLLHWRVHSQLSFPPMGWTWT